MEDKLQLLTKKIYEEGVVKAEEEAAKILAEANAKAASLVAAASEKATEIEERATQAAEALRNNVESELRLSGKQVISAIKQEIAKVITFKTSSYPIHEAMNDHDFLRQIIEIAVRNWNQNGQHQADLSLILPDTAQAQLDSYLSSVVRSLLDNGLELQFSKRITNGFRIGPADGGYVVSFAEQDFDNLFKEYLRPKTVELLFGNK